MKASEALREMDEICETCRAATNYAMSLPKDETEEQDSVRTSLMDVLRKSAKTLNDTTRLIDDIGRCPFCGYEHRLRLGALGTNDLTWEPEDFLVYCEHCEAAGPIAPTAQAALAMWSESSRVVVRCSKCQSVLTHKSGAAGYLGSQTGRKVSVEPCRVCVDRSESLKSLVLGRELSKSKALISELREKIGMLVKETDARAHG